MYKFWERWPRTSLAVVFALPFVVTHMSWAMAVRWAPGQFAVAQWRDLSAASFLLGGAAGVVLLFLRRAGRAKTVVLAGLWMAAFLLFAFCVSLQSRCGDEPQFIGETPATPVACG